MKILSEKLSELLGCAVNSSGSFNPSECVPYIEEDLTFEELAVVESFLGWVHRSHRTFGNNVKEVYLEFIDCNGYSYVEEVLERISCNESAANKSMTSTKVELTRE
jgi:hypothetical protein